MPLRFTLLRFTVPSSFINSTRHTRPPRPTVFVLTVTEHVVVVAVLLVDLLQQLLHARTLVLLALLRRIHQLDVELLAHRVLVRLLLLRLLRGNDSVLHLHLTALHVLDHLLLARLRLVELEALRVVARAAMLRVALLHLRLEGVCHLLQLDRDGRLALLQRLHHVASVLFLLRRDERDSCALVSRASRSSHTMHLHCHRHHTHLRSPPGGSDSRS